MDFLYLTQAVNKQNTIIPLVYIKKIIDDKIKKHQVIGIKR